MKRDLAKLSDTVFDLCIVGGGIYGACVAWDATLRGLSVALVDKVDFGHATSSNTLRIIHGGFRYLQDGDIVRMRESIRERMIWMRIAPHLIRPLPFIIPTYLNSIKTKKIFSLALLLYDLIGFDRNRIEDPEKYIPRGQVISKQECLQLVPALENERLTGAAIFYDGQMYNSERLILSFLKSAANEGAVVANYIEVIGFLKNGNRVTGVKAKDLLTGKKLDIRSKIVVNASGPWVGQVLDYLGGYDPNHPHYLSKAFNLVIRKSFSKYAIGLQGMGSKHFFITPWHDHSLIGTAHLPFGGEPDKFRICEKDIQGFIGEINRACSGISLKKDDIYFLHAGLLPAKNQSKHSYVQLMGRSLILDHYLDKKVDGLISVVGIKFTTARSVAEKVVDLVFKKFGYIPTISKSSETPIYGGRIGKFDTFLNEALAQKQDELTEDTIRHLVHNYGSSYPEVLKCSDSFSEGNQKITHSSKVIKSELLYGIREEMAQKLGDLVFRRTELGIFGYPGDACLFTCAAVMSKELGWDRVRTDKEIGEVKAAFSLGTGYA